MTQFNFTTNIEKRMPATGKVYCIDRMTSDYAEAHPLDVDGFIESVYQEFAGTEFEESREDLHKVWRAVLSVTSPCGDMSLYPNNDGAHRAAAMKVWIKAGDYWRRGLRLGDTLPEIVPGCKITRLGNGGWIALFPNDKHLLTTTNLTNETNDESAEEVTTNSTDETDNIEPARNQGEPKQLDLFAFEQMKAENERLQAQIAQMRAQQRLDDECAERFTREDSSSRPQPARRPQPSRRRAATVRRPQSQAVAAVDIEPENNHTVLKTLGFIAAASVALVIIYQTGLLIPLGLLGLASSGLLK